MRDETSELEAGALREEVQELERELARYQELVERLKAELATYRRGAAAPETIVPVHARYSRTLEEPGPESDVILEEAQARLRAALERLTGRRTRGNRRFHGRAP